MKTELIKFPPTPHLAVAAGVEVRDDKVMSEPERHSLLQGKLVIEEKVDGANLGISFDADGNIQAQNRGSYLQLPGSGQWKKLDGWLQSRRDALFEQLEDRYILFGEWCYAQHSVCYQRLPDWFLGFDVYERKTARFLSCIKRDRLLKAMDIHPVPLLAQGRFTLEKLMALKPKSKLGDEQAEGLYIRRNHGDRLAQRAKLIRQEFLQSIEKHWSHSTITPNHIKPGAYV